MQAYRPRRLSNTEGRWLTDRIQASRGLLQADQLISAWARGTPVESPLVAIVSSRLSHPWSRHRDWFAMLRRAVTNVGSTERLLLSPRTTTDRFVRRAARLYRLGTVELNFHRHPPRQLVDAALPASASQSVSPIELHLALEHNGPADRDIAARDRWILGLADRIVVLRVRHGGRLERALNMLQSPAVATRPGSRLLRSIQHSRIDLVSNSGGSNDELATPRSGRGSPDEADGSAIPRGTAAAIPIPDPCQVDRLQLDWIRRHRYLVHWTRACRDQWPDESETEYIDSLLFGQPRADGCPENTLRRILAQQRLIASDQSIRGKIPMVCFARITLRQLVEQTCYRRHRCRWDALPYGLAINLETLESRGARPVNYGTQVEIAGRPLAEQCWWQPVETRSGIDWTREREWRITGDMDLSLLPAYAAVVFVPHDRIARELAPCSRWPVVSLRGVLGMSRIPETKGQIETRWNRHSCRQFWPGP